MVGDLKGEVSRFQSHELLSSLEVFVVVDGANLIGAYQQLMADSIAAKMGQLHQTTQRGKMPVPSSQLRQFMTRTIVK